MSCRDGHQALAHVCLCSALGVLRVPSDGSVADTRRHGFGSGGKSLASRPRPHGWTCRAQPERATWPDCWARQVGLSDPREIYRSARPCRGDPSFSEVCTPMRHSYSVRGRSSLVPRVQGRAKRSGERPRCHSGRVVVVFGQAGRRLVPSVAWRAHPSHPRGMAQNSRRFHRSVAFLAAYSVAIVAEGTPPPAVDRLLEEAARVAACQWGHVWARSCVGCVGKLGGQVARGGMGREQGGGGWFACSLSCAEVGEDESQSNCVHQSAFRHRLCVHQSAFGSSSVRLQRLAACPSIVSPRAQSRTWQLSGTPASMRLIALGARRSSAVLLATVAPRSGESSWLGCCWASSSSRGSCARCGGRCSFGHALRARRGELSLERSRERSRHRSSRRSSGSGTDGEQDRRRCRLPRSSCTPAAESS